jgi:hypothetical protein
MDLTALLMLLTGISIVAYFGYKYVDDLANYVNIGQRAELTAGYLLFLLLPVSLALTITFSIERIPDAVITGLFGTGLLVMTLYIGLGSILKPQNLPAATRQLSFWPVICAIALWIVSYDRIITFSDGLILIGVAIVWLVAILISSKKNAGVADLLSVDLVPRRQVVPIFSGGQALMIWLGSLFAITVGAELVAYNLQPLIAKSGLTATVFGATIITAFCALTIIWRNPHEIIKPTPRAMIRDGYTAPIILAVLYLGVSALFHVVRVDKFVWQYYLPLLTVGLILTAVTLFIRKSTRPAGIVYFLALAAYLVVGFIAQ